VSWAKYKYYHCTHKSTKVKCSQRANIEEKELFAQVDSLLDKYEIDDELYQWGLKALEEMAKTEREEINLAQNMQFTSKKSIQKKLDNLLDLVTDGTIDPDDYKKRTQELKNQLANTARAEADANKRANDWYNTIESTLTYLCDAHSKFITGDITVKRIILRAIGQNFSLTDGKIGIEAHYWVKPIENYLAGEKKVRTLHQQIEKAPNGAKISNWCG